MGYKEQDTGAWVSSMDASDFNWDDVYETFWLEFEVLQAEEIMEYWKGTGCSESLIIASVVAVFNDLEDDGEAINEDLWEYVIKNSLVNGGYVDDIINNTPVIKAHFEKWLEFNSHRWEE